MPIKRRIKENDTPCDVPSPKGHRQETYTPVYAHMIHQMLIQSQHPYTIFVNFPLILSFDTMT